MRSERQSFWPRSLASLVALLLIGGAFAYAFSEETPLGAVQGRVVLEENSKPLSGAEITLSPTGLDAEESPRPSRYAIANEQGNFSLRHVPAGSYYITASTSEHNSSSSYLSIDEGRTTPLEMAAKRTQPDFKLNQDQRIFATNETARVGVTGYVDTKKETAHQPDFIHVSLWRTRLSAILQDKASEQAFQSVGRGYDRAPTLPAEVLHPKFGAAPQKVLDQDFPVSGADREGFFHLRLPFNALKAGTYLVSLAHAGFTDCTWMLVTDTALVVKRAQHQVIAYTVDMRTGQPLAGSQVRAYRGGKVIASSQTDENGIAEIRLAHTGPKRRPAPAATNGGDTATEGDAAADDGEGDSETGDSARITTIAMRGEDEAVVARDYYRNEGEGQIALHAYTDRPIYRPGQRISFKGIARRRNELPDQGFVDGHVKGQYSIPAGLPVKVEIRDPSGERILKQNFRLNSYGSFNGQADLDPEAPTGVYSMITTIDGEEKTHDIVIASYRKPEYAVKVTPDKKRYARGETVNMTVDAQYYFGAPLAGAFVKYSVFREHDYAGEYANPEDAEDASDTADTSDGEGGSVGDSYYGAAVMDGETRLDENGKAVLSFVAQPPEDPEGPQADQYTVSVTVKEGEGREEQKEGIAHVVSGDFRLDVSAEGYMAAPGQAVPVTLTARDHDGAPVPNVALELEAGYHTWKAGEYSYTKISLQQGVTGPDGKVTLTIIAPRSGELLLKGRAWDGHRRKIIGRDYLWVTDDAGGDLDTEYSDLSLHTDKKHYNPGDTARVLVNAAHTGETVLLTIEGDRIYHTQTLPMTQKSAVVRILLPAEYGPNIYLSACYVRDKKFATSEAPLRVLMPQTQVNVQIRADRDTPLNPPASGGTRASIFPPLAGGRGVASQLAGGSEKPVLARYSPGDKITYQVQTTDAMGKPVPCEFSFGIVDESIYALKEDAPTALRDSFYPHRANVVQTEYSFAIAYMGDADKSEPQVVTRKKFPDTAYWNPELTTDAQGRATVSFDLPDNLTTWRATATAHTLDTRLGRATEKILSAKDFQVRLQTPRFLTQHDHTRIVALVHNDTGSPQTATVKLESDGLNLESPATQQVNIEPGRQGEVVWGVAAERIGDAKLVVKAWTPKGANGIQYTDGMEAGLPVKAHGREIVTAESGELTADQPLTRTLRFDPNAIPDASQLTVRITPSLSGALFAATDYLIGFPYGCTEQTMSRFLPDLLVQKAMRLHGLDNVKRAGELPRMVRNGLQRLYRFQHGETGGWGWWEHDKDDAWMTAYVLYGLSTAQAEGYPVSQNALKKGRKAALALLQQSDNATSQDNRAFLLYALALTGDTPDARAGQSRLKISGLSSQSLGYVILLNRLLGQPSDAALAELSKRAVSTDGMLHWKIGRFVSWDWDDQTTNATVLRALLALNRSDPRIPEVLRWLMLQRTGDHWSSTRDTSWILAAFCDYLSVQGEQTTGGEVHITLNGKEWPIAILTPDMTRENEVLYSVAGANLKPGQNTISFQRTGGSSLVFVSVELRQTVAQEDIPALSRSVADLGLSPPHGLPASPGMASAKTENPNGKLEVQREYLRVLPKKAGGDRWSLQTEPTQNQLQEGDRIRVRLTLNVPREMAYILIEDPFPSGCEVTERGTAEEVVEWGYWWDSVDVRDDKIAFFVRRLSPGQHVIEYNLRAMTHGSYHVLPTLLQGMYAPESRAESAETRLTVR